MNVSALSEFDLFLYHQGTNYHAYEMLGAHFLEQDGKKGVRFSVWAPHAKSVSVVGDFNEWDTRTHTMQKIGDGEIWVIFIEGLEEGEVYKYAIEPQWGGPHIMKADPYGFYAEKKPKTASRLYNLNKYQWNDAKWQERKKTHPSYANPMLTYEVHLGSWRRTLDGEYLSYRELADQLVGYAKKMNYTHIEIMPLCEHPFDGSWGYQATGYYAVTSRYGEPDDFRYFVDTAHKNGIAVIMDWVPGHFCKDEQGLRHFDGMTLYESDNEQRAENWEWGTTNFDYGRTEVQSFLISNAMFWFEEYHIDGLRIDAVANMLYLNYGRKDGEWQPNKYGDTGNLEAMDFIKKLNEAIFKFHPNALMIAEESTSWPLISKPVYMGGMGFNYKWNMGWMNDMLSYMSLDPIYRKWNQDKVTFSFMYAFSENFVLPLSHDEVVHGKCSLVSKMPGDYWQKFAGLRGFFGYWMAHPGKKLLFMGGEFAQFIEWNYDDSLDWHLVEEYPMHTKMLEYSRALNQFYTENRPFWEVDFDWNGFEWIDCNDSENSIITFVRKSDAPDDFIVVLCNFTPEVRHDYRIGVPKKGAYIEVFNSDAEEFGGSGVKNEGELYTEDYGWHEREQSLVITVPPMATIYLRHKDAVPFVKRSVSEEEDAVLVVKGVEKKKAKAPKKPAAKSPAAQEEAKQPAAKAAPKKAAAKASEEKKTAVKARSRKTESTKSMKKAEPPKKSGKKKAAAAQ
ncbi:1,4-alpha-glucan branching protein GlgB [Selenomonas sp.]|uniref:1,4-alpha-glucan branching protein GlgB n=1 Tax=Selenomonas sp. TaxID=2053611 RepID=UPI003FA1F91A